MPRTLLADVGGAERGVSAALAALFARDEPSTERYVEVALADAAEAFARPWRHGVTGPAGVLGGGSPFYRMYQAADGWIAVGALEPHFQRGVLELLGLDEPDDGAFSETFRRRTAADWESIAVERDLPIVRVSHA